MRNYKSIKIEEAYRSMYDVDEGILSRFTRKKDGNAANSQSQNTFNQIYSAVTSLYKQYQSVLSTLSAVAERGDDENAAKAKSCREKLYTLKQSMLDAVNVVRGFSTSPQQPQQQAKPQQSQQTA